VCKSSSDDLAIPDNPTKREQRSIPKSRVYHTMKPSSSASAQSATVVAANCRGFLLRTRQNDLAWGLYRINIFVMFTPSAEPVSGLAASSAFGVPAAAWFHRRRDRATHPPTTLAVERTGIGSRAQRFADVAPIVCGSPRPALWLGPSRCMIAAIIRTLLGLSLESDRASTRCVWIDCCERLMDQAPSCGTFGSLPTLRSPAIPDIKQAHEIEGASMMACCGQCRG